MLCLAVFFDNAVDMSICYFAWQHCLTTWSRRSHLPRDFAKFFLLLLFFACSLDFNPLVESLRHYYCLYLLQILVCAESKPRLL